MRGLLSTCHLASLVQFQDWNYLCRTYLPSRGLLSTCHLASLVQFQDWNYLRRTYLRSPCYFLLPSHWSLVSMWILHQAALELLVLGSSRLVLEPLWEEAQVETRELTPQPGILALLVF